MTLPDWVSGESRIRWREVKPEQHFSSLRLSPLYGNVVTLSMFMPAGFSLSMVTIRQEVSRGRRSSRNGQTRRAVQPQLRAHQSCDASCQDGPFIDVMRKWSHSGLLQSDPSHTVSPHCKTGSPQKQNEALRFVCAIRIQRLEIQCSYEFDDIGCHFLSPIISCFFNKGKLLNVKFKLSSFFKVYPFRNML